VWGALYALETLSQLIQWDDNLNTYFVAQLPTIIVDTPRYAWRGLLIDTSRHYLHPNTIKSAIEVAAFNKYNVLHWHVTDAQSFPIESKAYPKLIEGAYNKRAVYSHEAVRDIVSYGYARGVRVLAEFDIPGHAAGFSYGYPEVTAKCPRFTDINDVSLDVSNDFTYELLNGFLKEMTDLFPDEYIHLGGDEVVFGCWFDDPNIARWAASKGFRNGNQIEEYFEQKLQAMVLPGNQNNISKKMVVWEELFENGVSLRSDVIVQVWSSRDLLQKVLNSGHQALLSQGYYLDKQIPDPNQTWYHWVDTWKNFYLNEPLEGLHLTPAQEKLLLGGEAAMWGEQVDDTNFHSRVWPRASATAERLWSQKSVNNVDAAEPRLNAFRCHLARRGVGAGPVLPDFCDLPRYH
jgi:hexosaminidase